MAKFRISPDLVKVLLPVVIPILKDLAAKTTTTVDDKLVAALEMAANNPVVMAILLSLLNGESPTLTVFTADPDDKVAGQLLVDNSELVCALFGVAKPE